MRRVVAVVLAFSIGGCGLLQTRGPDPRQPADQRPVCSETFDAPKRDAYGAIAGFGTILVGLLFLKAGDNEAVGTPLIIGGAVLMAGSYVSGGIGYFRVKRCRKAIAEFERRTAPPPSAAPLAAPPAAPPAGSEPPH